MKKNLKWVYYRHPRTRAEARENQEGWERPRRRPRNLPNSYDDRYPQADSKSWKAKRKTQYHTGGRGKEHSIVVDYYHTYEWDLQEYFKEHDIPHRIEYVYESHVRKLPKWKRVCLGVKPVFYFHMYKKDGQTCWGHRFSHYTEKYEWQRDGYEWKNVKDIVAYRVIWWCDKDIGIEYILKQCRRKRLHSYI